MIDISNSPKLHMNIDLYKGDCLEVMGNISDKSIDMILCDLPYGTTQNKWDSVIPFNKYIEVENKRHKKQIMYENDYILNELETTNKSYQYIRDEFNEKCKNGLWEHYNRIIKDNGAIVLFGQDKFTAELMLSNKKIHRYNLIWDKVLSSGFLNANRMPLREHEDILVFYKKLPTYNPQKIKGNRCHSKGKVVGKMNDSQLQNNNYRDFKCIETEGDMKFPTSILRFQKPHPSKSIHPTQKPIGLLECLIKTYTNEEQTVLDNCMGSGSTGIPCLDTNRNFKGIEKESTYFDISVDRVKKHIENNKIECNLSILAS